MSAKKTLVTLLLDGSGSMDLIKDDTIGAINAYTGTLKKAGEDIRFSLVKFSSQGSGMMDLEKIFVAKKVSKIPAMTDEDYVPRGGTPLIDAACTTIQAIAASLEGRDDTKVVVAIQTDGNENSSCEFTWNDLKRLISEKEEMGWEFLFMGCGINAYDQGSKMGIKASKTLSYGKNQAETRAAFAATAENTALYALGAAACMDYSALQKRSAGDGR